MTECRRQCRLCLDIFLRKPPEWPALIRDFQINTGHIPLDMGKYVFFVQLFFQCSGMDTQFLQNRKCLGKLQSAGNVGKLP